MTLHIGSAPKPISAPSNPRDTRARRVRKDRLAAIPFLSGAVGFVGLILLIPLSYTIVRSLFGNGDVGFVGLDNYVTLFTDPNLQRSLLNTLIFTVGSLILPVAFGLAIAVMTDGSSWGGWARAAVLIPSALAGTVTAIIGNMLFTSSGSINQFLATLGVIDADHPIGWLLQWPHNIISAILISSWAATGGNTVLFLVGLRTIPRETLEAAALDGAGGWIRFKDIIFPQLRATTAVVIGLTITNALRAFDVIQVLTKGGPNRTSETLALSMYRQSFLNFDQAVGSAIAVVLSVIVVLCSWFYLRRQIGKET